jgi:solute:Na+ symporter, SSS family
VLKSFYKRVRPWGFWGPVLARVQKDDPAFQPNQDFGRDMFNVLVGMCWQTSLVVVPVAIVIRKFDTAITAGLVVAVAAVILKFTWYDHLEKRERPEASQAAA